MRISQGLNLVWARSTHMLAIRELILLWKLLPLVFLLSHQLSLMVLMSPCLVDPVGKGTSPAHLAPGVGKQYAHVGYPGVDFAVEAVVPGFSC